jgi:hypothetical protein
MNKNLLSLLVGIVLVLSSILMRIQIAGNAWQIVLGIGIMLEIVGVIGIFRDVKNRNTGA